MHDFTPISALAGGALIGMASVWLLAANGRIAGVSGLGRLSARSLAAVCVFMASGMVSVYAMRHLLGVTS